MKKIYQKLIVVICCLFFLSGCGLKDALSSLLSQTINSSSSPIGGTNQEGCKVYSNLDVLIENESVSLLTASSTQDIINHIGESTFMATACYVVQGVQYERLASGFIVKKEVLEDAYKYYLVSNASKLFYRSINTKTGATIVSRTPEYIEVVFGNYKRYYAKIEKYYERLDIIVLSIETKDELNVLPLGDSDNVGIGDSLYSMGTPEIGISLLNTLIKGNVSGLYKDSTLYYNNEQVTSYITHQLDAPTNIGMEGGPVFNDKGEVVGILTYKYGGGDDYESLSRFIPINSVKNCLNNFLNGLDYNIPTVGLSVMDLHNAVANDYISWANPMGIYTGCFVDEVVYGSASYNAGIKAKGIVIGAYLNGEYFEIKGNAYLSTILVLYKEGDTLKFEVQYQDSKEVYTIFTNA